MYVGDKCREYAIVAGIRQYGAQHVPEVAFGHQPVAQPDRLPRHHVLWCDISAAACLHQMQQAASKQAGKQLLIVALLALVFLSIWPSGQPGDALHSELRNQCTASGKGMHVVMLNTGEQRNMYVVLSGSSASAVGLRAAH